MLPDVVVRRIDGSLKAVEATGLDLEARLEDLLDQDIDPPGYLLTS